MHSDYRLPVSFLGAIAAVLMLIYPVSLFLIYTIETCYNIIIILILRPTISLRLTHLPLLILEEKDLKVFCQYLVW